MPDTSHVESLPRTRSKGAAIPIDTQKAAFLRVEPGKRRRGPSRTPRVTQRSRAATVELRITKHPLADRSAAAGGDGQDRDHPLRPSRFDDVEFGDFAPAGVEVASTSFGLTLAEKEVLALAAQGRTNEEIAQVRGCRAGTVRIQLSAVFRKLQVRNRTGAILIALRLGLVTDRQAEMMQAGPMELGSLMPHLEHRRYRAGSVLFRRGEEARELFVVQRGRVQLVEGGSELVSGDHFGEIGLFSPSRIRPSTAVCVTDTSLFALESRKVRQLYVTDAGFALTLLASITRRLMEDTAYIA